MTVRRITGACIVLAAVTLLGSPALAVQEPSAETQEAGPGSPSASGDDPVEDLFGTPFGAFGFGYDFTFPTEPPPPVVVGAGADALLRAPDLRVGNEPTLLEQYGAQPYTIEGGGGFGSETDGALNAVAGGIFGVATWLAAAVVAIVQWTFSLELFDFVGDAVVAIVGALRDTLYLPLVQAAVIIAGLTLAWHGLVRRRGTRTLEGAVWVLAALAAAGVFFVRPAALVDAANHTSTGLSRAMLAAVSVADPKTGPADGLSTTATYQGHPADTQLRVASDRFWRVFIYQPWLVLQFGDADRGAAYGERLLAARTVTAEEIEAAEGDADAVAALWDRKRDEAAAVHEEVLADEQLASWYRGRRAVERTGVATLALTGVVAGGALLALVAAAILIAQIAFLLLVLLGPTFLLVGIHPGVGRVVAVRWIELALGLLVKRVALGAVLSVLLVLMGVLLDATYPLGWLVVVGLQALVVAAAVVYRKPFTGLFAPTTVPAVNLDVVRRVGPPLREVAGRPFDRWRTVREAARPSPQRRRAAGGAGVPPATRPPAPASLRPAAVTARRDARRAVVAEGPREGNGHGVDAP